MTYIYFVSTHISFFWSHLIVSSLYRNNGPLEDTCRDMYRRRCDSGHHLLPECISCNNITGVLNKLALQCIFERRTAEVTICGGSTMWAWSSCSGEGRTSSAHQCGGETSSCVSLSSMGRELVWLKSLWSSTTQTSQETKGQMSDACCHKTEVPC